MNRDPIGKRNKSAKNSGEATDGSSPAAVGKSISVELARPKPEQQFGVEFSPILSVGGGGGGRSGGGTSSFSITTSSTTTPLTTFNPLTIAQTEQLMNGPIGISAASLAQIALPQPIRPMQNNYGGGGPSIGGHGGV